MDPDLDPHDEYYAHQQAHREELSDWFGRRLDRRDRTFRRVIAVGAILLVAAGSASASFLGIFE